MSTGLLSAVLLITTASLLVSADSVDMTVTVKATGSDVVNAVVDLIDQSCIFPDDKLLLRRIAYVESLDGQSGNTFEHGGVVFYGGIWQVDSDGFTATLSGLSVTVRTQIKTVFGIDWTTVQYSDLQKPLYSGLAARLRIQAYYTTNNIDIPQDVNSQAVYWSKYYTINSWGNANVTISIFVGAAAEVTSTCSSPKADVVFVLDGSGSIGALNFDQVQVFAEDVVASFDVGPQQVRVALIEFSTTSVTEFDLTTFTNKTQIIQAIRNLPYYAQSTNTSGALEQMASLIEQQGRQAEGVPVVVIFMTDGQSNDPKATAAAAVDVHHQLPQVTIFSVGVGQQVDVTELDTIASNPSCLHVFQLTGFDYVSAFTSQIMNEACKVPAELSPDNEIRGTLAQNQTYYFRIRVQKLNKGVKVQIKTPQGGVKTFFSWKVHNPSAALYDSMATADVTITAGVAVFVPWSDDAVDPNQQGQDGQGHDSKPRHRRDVSQNVTGVLYGAVVGSQTGQNSFDLSYSSNPDSNTASAMSSTCLLLAVGLAMAARLVGSL